MGAIIGKSSDKTGNLDDAVKNELKRADKVINFASRQVTAEFLSKVSNHPQHLRNVVHLSLAKNPLTRLVFIDLFVYDGVLALAPTLKTLKLSSNNILKVPTGVWRQVPACFACCA
jgi:Leucine-rich repeat (LRR) protein